MKKIYILLVLWCTALSFNLYAEEGVVDRIDHPQAMVVISDTAYKMALNMKVYDSDLRPVNRYALRAGRKVFIQAAERKSAGRMKTLTSVMIIE